MALTYIMFVVAIALSAVAAFYSIVGLAAIFSAAVLPIVIMGTILEIAKLTVTVWLHEYWRQCKLIMKLYLVPAVAVLMIITSMGIFGFLSKAHIDQVIPTGDKSAQLALFDERIANERAIIENSRSLIKQMDDTVNGIIAQGESREIKLRDGRTIVRSPAELALQVRRSQAQDRDRLTKTIEESQAKIVAIQEERAPIAKEIRGLEAEVGPIKYVAALIYGDNPDANLLERAVRWMIIILVAVFDPLAVMMLLAATESRAWYLRDRKDTPHEPVVPPDNDTDLPGTAQHADDGSDKLESINVADPTPASHTVIEPRRTEPTVPYQVLDDDSIDEPPPQVSPASQAVLYVDPDFIKAVTEPPKPAYLDKGGFGFRDTKPMVAQPVTEEPPAPDVDAEVDPNPAIVYTEEVQADDDDDPYVHHPVMKQAKALWKADNPQKTLKEMRRLVLVGKKDHVPWLDYLDDPRIVRETGFGADLPSEALRGDTWVRTNHVPTLLYKFNGDRWIQVDKNTTDSYSYNTAYIDYLINKISTGEYDPDMLTDSEREQIEQRLGREAE
jgi:hypothetical protein